MAKVITVGAAILATVLLFASSKAAEVCVLPDRFMMTCMEIDDLVQLGVDCRGRSEENEMLPFSGGRFYTSVEECCKSEFSGKCKDYTNCVYPDKNMGTCIHIKVKFKPRDCLPLAQKYGGLRSRYFVYDDIAKCCAKEFDGKCKDYSNCVYPDKSKGTCITTKVEFSPRDCPLLSARAGGKGSFYGDISDCCAKEFGGKCKDYSNCVFPDKSMGTCLREQVEFSPRDCPLISARAGGKGSFYSNIPDCCAKEFGGKCKDYSNCVYPDKAAFTCFQKKVEFAPVDCTMLSGQYGGKGSYYGTIADCCAKEFGNRCKTTATAGK